MLHAHVGESEKFLCNRVASGNVADAPNGSHNPRLTIVLQFDHSMGSVGPEGL